MTYAVVKTLRDATVDDFSPEFKEVQKAFWLLASSFAGFQERNSAAMSLRPPLDSMSVRDVGVFDRSTDGYRVNFRYNIARQPNICEGFWVRNSKRCHFSNLQKLLDGKLQVDSPWKASIIRAATLFGQSFVAKHLAEAFTYDMIAMETLLCQRNDKFPDALVDRIVAIFGWLTNEDREPWKSSVSQLYQLRCGYVHDGMSGDIKGMDLHFADTLLQNLLTNLCANTRHIKKKDDLIKLALQLQAFQTLGQKPKRKPRFTYSVRSLSQKDEDKVNDTSQWEW